MGTGRQSAGHASSKRFARVFQTPGASHIRDNHFEKGYRARSETASVVPVVRLAIRDQVS